MWCRSSKGLSPEAGMTPLLTAIRRSPYSILTGGRGGSPSAGGRSRVQAGIWTVNRREQVGTPAGHSLAQLTGRVDLRLRILNPESWRRRFLLSKSLSTDPQRSVLGSCQTKAPPFPQAPRQRCRAELGRKWETGRVELLAGSRRSVSEGPGDLARQASQTHSRLAQEEIRLSTLANST